LWISGSPNQPKEGIAPLSAVVEADWSPYTFTMNWQFTRRNHWIGFEKHEPICFIFPVQRGALERMEPKFVALDEHSDLVGQFRAWSASRNAFQAEMAQGKPLAPSEKWQKRYYRGLDMHDQAPAADHRTRLRLKAFVAGTPAEPVERVELDEMQLAGVLAAARNGANNATMLRALTEAGIPAAAASRIVAAAART
jgi:hypothetical protein